MLRPRTAAGDLGPRYWKGLFTFLGTIFVAVILYTSIHVVQPGSVAVPVTFGHAGEPLKAGFHPTWPFTKTYSMSTRTQNYTMSALKGEGAQKNADDSVAVLGRDGGERERQRHRAVPARPEQGQRRVPHAGRELPDADRAAVGAQLHPRSSSPTTTWSPRRPPPGTRSSTTSASA